VVSITREISGSEFVRSPELQDPTSEIDGGKALGIPEDAGGDIDVDGEGLMAEVDRLEEAPAKLDATEFGNVASIVCEEFATDRDEGEGWTRGKEMIEKGHRLEDGRRVRASPGVELFDRAKRERGGPYEAEGDFFLSAWDLDVKVGNNVLAPSESCTYDQLHCRGKYHRR
jgi:hypothetical protein